LTGFVFGVAGLSLLALGTDLYWPYYAAAGSLMTALAGWAAQSVMDRRGINKRV